MAKKAKPIQDRVKSYEDACAVKDITPLTIENFSFLPENQQKAALAYHKIHTIAEVLNEGEIFSWQPDSDWKYYPWFDMETYGDAPAGSGFSYGGYGLGRSRSFVGARLCYRTSELAKYAGTQFLDIYRDLMKQ
jgi:hypothetical protein